MNKVEAFILKKAPHGEADELLTCYSKELGLMRLRARGVRKAAAKHAGALMELNMLDIFFVEGRSVPIITDTTMRESFRAVKESREKLRAARAVCYTLSDTFPLGVIDILLWWQLGEYLHVLEAYEGPGTQLEVAPAFFLFTLLRLYGTGPQLERCAVCGKVSGAEERVLSADEGGIAHARCVKKRTAFPLSSASWEAMAAWDSLSLKDALSYELSRTTRKELVAAMNGFTLWHLGSFAAAA